MKNKLISSEHFAKEFQASYHNFLPLLRKNKIWSKQRKNVEWSHCVCWENEWILCGGCCAGNHNLPEILLTQFQAGWSGQPR